MKTPLSLLIVVALTVWTQAQGPGDAGAPAAAPRQLPLVQRESLVYEGSFGLRLPGDVNGTRWGFGGTALAFNLEAGTLYAVGHDQHQKAAEIQIPELRKPPAELLNATLVQHFFDPVDGKWNQIGPRGMAKVGGLLPWNDRLIVSVFHYYDASGRQRASHFVSGRDLSVSTDAEGPYKVGNLQTGYISGYMAVVPEVWRPLLGGPAFTGNCCIPIISRTSYGPALFAFNPADVGGGKTVPAAPLLYYPQEAPLAGWSATNPLFNGTTQIGGVVLPEGTRSVLFFGRHGTGTFCYGTKCFPGAGQGNHAAPYITQVWAYDAAQLADVKAGKRKPWEVKPYATWEMLLPIRPDNKTIKGVAYDPRTGRIFLSQAQGELPLVHVYKIQLP